MPQPLRPRKIDAPLPLEEPAPDLPYRIEHVTQRLGRPQVIARTGDLTLALAMFEAAVRQHPADRVELWHGQQMIAGRG